MTLDERAPAVVRARELIAPWTVNERVIGAYITGSATRPYVDRNSDLDIIVVAEDELYRSLTPKQRFKTGIDRGPPRRKEYDLVVMPWSELESLQHSDRDNLRVYFRHVYVLFDRADRLATVAHAIGELAPEVRAERLRVHYFEYVSRRAKAIKCLHRGKLANARMVAAASLAELTKCLFVAAGAWVTKAEWAPQELRALGVPEALVARLEWNWLHLAEAPDEDLHQLTSAWFASIGVDVHANTIELTNWAMTDPGGIAATNRWTKTF
jgi:predicted nucleotidyltransferase